MARLGGVAAVARARGPALARGGRGLAAALAGGTPLGRPSGSLLARAGVGLVAAFLVLVGPTSTTSAALLGTTPTAGVAATVAGSPPAGPVSAPGHAAVITIPQAAPAVLPQSAPPAGPAPAPQAAPPTGPAPAPPAAPPTGPARAPQTAAPPVAVAPQPPPAPAAGAAPSAPVPAVVPTAAPQPTGRPVGGLTLVPLPASPGPGHAADRPAPPAPSVLFASDRADPIAATYLSPSRVETRSFASPTLGRTMPYFVYVPPGYDTSDRRYPVVYMLHGMGGSNTEWQGYGLFGAADDLIKSGAIPPMLIVLPQGDQSYWFDHADGTRWGRYTAVDVVAEVDRGWRTIPDRADRAVGGLSMGALGALKLGVNYPDVFGIVGAHSPTLRDWADSADWFPPDFYGHDPAYFAKFDPTDLYQLHPDAARRLRIWIDVGEGDVDWRPTTTAFHDELTDLGIPHEFHVLPGDHNGDRYWGPHGAEYLRFYAGAFAGAPTAPA